MDFDCCLYYISEAYRNASKIYDVSDNLIIFVDEKRWNSWNRSQMLQKKADIVLNGGLPDYSDVYDSMSGPV